MTRSLCFSEALGLIQRALPNGKSDPAWFDQLPSCRFFLFNLTPIKKKIEMIYRCYAPLQLLALSLILYLTVQKGTPASAGPKTGPGNEQRWARCFLKHRRYRYFVKNTGTRYLKLKVRRYFLKKVPNRKYCPIFG